MRPHHSRWLGRLRLGVLILASCGSVSASAAPTRYFYDAAGRLTGTTTEGGAIDGYTYDPAHNRRHLSRYVGAVPAVVDQLRSGEVLHQGQSLRSGDSRYVLPLQEDGNVVLYSNGNPIWATDTWLRQGATLIMQHDGNLVLYGPQHNALWASNTSGNPGATLVVQGDGNLVIYSTSGVPLWASGTSGL